MPFPGKHLEGHQDLLKILHRPNLKGLKKEINSGFKKFGKSASQKDMFDASGNIWKFFLSCHRGKTVKDAEPEETGST